MKVNAMKMTILLALTLSICISGCSNNGDGFSTIDMALLETSGRTLSAIGAVAAAPGNLVRSMSAMGDPVMEVHGKVLDCYGNLMEGVKVSAYYTHGNTKKDLSFVTGSNGSFLFEGKASSISIRRCQKEGYEFDLRDNPGWFLSCSDIKRINDKLVSNSSNPLVLKMRKFGPVKYVAYKSEILDLSKTEKNEHGLHLVDRWLDEYGFSQKLDKSSHYCLNVVIEYIKVEDKFDVYIKSTGDSGGVLIDNNCLHIAPEKGYSSQVKFSLKKTYGSGGEYLKDRHLEFYRDRPTIYAKCGQCNMYSRLNISMLGSKYNLEMITSPEGQRYLEYQRKRSSEVINQRKQLSRRYWRIRQRAEFEYKKKKSNYRTTGYVKPFDEMALKEEFIKTIQQERNRKQN